MSRYVASQADLEELAGDLEGSEVLALDTEFLREKTYYAKLCLIQINNEKFQAIIDPLAVDDLTVLAPILTDKRCVKVFHAGGQDLDILYHEVGVMPTPLFDTQLAAALLGFPQQIGYGSLVKGMCDVKLDKTEGYTDWSRRPLSKYQVRYALDDVVYLPQLYRTMVNALDKRGRLEWLEQDFAALADVSRYKNDPWEMWRKVKRIATLTRSQLAIVRELAAWREREAQRRNLPRKWVIPDEAIIDIARKAPSTAERLLEVRGLGSRLNRKAVNELLEAVRRARELPAERLPKLERRPQGDVQVEGVVDLMAAVVDIRASENDVAMQVLASRDDLSRLAHGHRDECKVLGGWRYEMVGRELVDLLEGRLALYVNNGAIQVKNLG